MSGGGASPTLKNIGYTQLGLDGPDTTALLLVGGRCRFPCLVSPTEGITHVITMYSDGPRTRAFALTPISQLYGSSALMADRLRQIYGAVTPTISESGVILEFDGIVVNSHNDQVGVSNIYSELGFVEGVARITTPVGDAACVVKNGTLYPIITEYDQATEDNWTLQNVYLNGDNEVSNLQQMVDRSGSYLAYTEDQEADKWSPIENYLHMHVKMPIVPKIGYVPAEQVGLGNVLPGLNYAVTL